MRKPKFLIWYGVWAGQETNIFRLVKTKGTARALISDLKNQRLWDGCKFGYKRLLEKPAHRRKRRKKR